MPDDRILRIFLDDGPLEQARAGRHNFLVQVARALTDSGWRHEFRPDTLPERLAHAARPDWSLRFMREPMDDRSFVFRRVYFYPFWQIERSEKRWERDVALADFATAEIDRDAATTFANYWRNRRYSGQNDANLAKGHIFVPLQGRLLEHRSFQSMAPVDMLDAVLARFHDRHVVATLHPKETYGADEREALSARLARHPNLQLSTGGAETQLRRCAFVVTQNSGVAFQGYFYRKPAVLFAQSDFHHIAASVPHIGPRAAFDLIETLRPDFDGYLWWFLQVMSLNAGRDAVRDQIVAAFRHGGMPI
jgi:hypothetical protein